MEMLKKTLLVIIIFSIWAYLTTVITEFVISRPMYPFVQLTFSIGIISYTFLCFHLIYKYLTKTNTNK
jgi:hypothetical protein